MYKWHMKGPCLLSTLFLVKKTGIFPFDANAFQEADFAPSLVTDHPDHADLGEDP